MAENVQYKDVLELEISQDYDSFAQSHGIVAFARSNGDAHAFDGAILQKKLESGTSIKTINGESLLSSGNLNLQEGPSELPTLMRFLLDMSVGETQTKQLSQHIFQNGRGHYFIDYQDTYYIFPLAMCEINEDSDPDVVFSAMFYLLHNNTLKLFRCTGVHNSSLPVNYTFKREG